MELRLIDGTPGVFMAMDSLEVRAIVESAYASWKAGNPAEPELAVAEVLCRQGSDHDYLAITMSYYPTQRRGASTASARRFTSALPDTHPGLGGPHLTFVQAGEWEPGDLLERHRHARNFAVSRLTELPGPHKLYVADHDDWRDEGQLVVRIIRDDISAKFHHDEEEVAASIAEAYAAEFPDRAFVTFLGEYCK